jgi:hypothetical protein
MAGAGWFWEKNTVGWLLVASLLWEKSTAGGWLISQTNTLRVASAAAGDAASGRSIDRSSSSVVLEPGARAGSLVVWRGASGNWTLWLARVRARICDERRTGERSAVGAVPLPACAWDSLSGRPERLSLSLPSYPWRLEQTNFPFSSSNPLQLQHCAVLCHAQCLLTVPRSMFLLSTLGMFAWLMSHQQTVFYSQNKSATNSQQYFSLKTNQHQLSATSQTNR